jgi:hypothetical protein
LKDNRHLEEGKGDHAIVHEHHQQHNRCSGGRRRIRIMTKRLYRNAIRFLVKHLGSNGNE